MNVLPFAVLLLLSGSGDLRLDVREREAFAYLRKADQLQMPTVGYASQYSGG